MDIYEVWFANSCESKFYLFERKARSVAEDYIKNIFSEDEQSLNEALDEFRKNGMCIDIVAVNKIKVDTQEGSNK